MSPLKFLIVEDNPADAALTRRALEFSGISSEIRVVQDGDAALDVLHQRGKFKGEALPDIVLLDLNMPKRNGLQVLADVKTCPGIRRIPIIVLTTSTDLVDVERAYEAYANSFMAKPMTWSGYDRIIEGLKCFWAEVAHLPPKPIDVN